MGDGQFDRDRMRFGVPPGMSARERRDSPRAGIFSVHVDLHREQQVLATWVLVTARAVTCMPYMARELVVGGVEEGVALVLVLADEDHEGRDAVVGQFGVAPPGAEQRVVAEELLEVLVESARAVV